MICSDSWFRRVGPLLVGPVCILYLFAGVLSGRDRLAFRDVSYFYTPLYQHVADLCSNQPWGAWGHAIWNPNDLTGMPLAGETTTAVFYPLRILVYSLGTSAETSIGIYVVLHLLIASVAAYWMALRFRCRRCSASVVGLVYPLSGTVLFLATNPPYLVSAAWLPFVLGSLLLRTTSRSVRSTDRPSLTRWKGNENGRSLKVPALAARYTSLTTGSILVPGVAMSLMILGGDPPTAFHCVLISGFIGISSFWTRRTERWPQRVEPLVQLTLVCLVACVLALPQIASSLDWARHSDRLQNSSTVFHDAFSLAPWRLAEFVFPNFYGSPWPIHHRWDRLVFDGGASRPQTALWTPSVYCGSIVLLLVGSVFHLAWSGRCRFQSFRRRRHIRWIFAGGFALLASMGSYTPIYPWLVEWVPGYQTLRYPSKWLPIVTLVVSLWSGQGFQYLFSNRVARTRQANRRIIGGWLIIFPLAIAICSWAAWNMPRGEDLADLYWGPFQLDVARSQIGVSCLHCLVAVSALLMIGFAKERWPGWRIVKHSHAMALVCVALDLIIAHQTLVPRVNRADELARLTSSKSIAEQIRWMNWVGANAALPHWRTESSPDRMLEVETTLRSCWFGRWHLEHGQAKFNSLVSIRQNEVSDFWKHTREQTKSLSASQSSPLWDRWHDKLGVGGIIERQDNATVLKRIGSPIDGVVDEFRVHTGRPIVKSRAVYQDGHWTATLLNQDDSSDKAATKTLVVRSDGELGQSVTIPPGNWLVRWRYSPWFHNGARWIAMIGWGLAAGWFFATKLAFSRSLVFGWK